MDTHTHRGHCQYCLRVIAIDVHTGKLAKHGYTVEGGMFQGQCPGSEVLSLHVDRTHTDSTIKLYQMKAANLRTHLANLESGADHPAEAMAGEPYYGDSDEQIMKYWRFETRKVSIPRINRSTGKADGTREIDQNVTVSWDDASPIQKRRAMLFAKSEAKHGAEKCESFAKDMTKWAAEIFGTEAYLADDLENWAKVGDVVHTGGKKNGFDAKIEATEMRDYTTFGYRTGRTTIKAPHVQITRPAIADTFHKNGSVKKKGRPAATYWEAVRNVQPAEGSLIARLKADNLI